MSTPVQNEANAINEDDADTHTYADTDTLDPWVLGVLSPSKDLQPI